VPMACQAAAQRGAHSSSKATRHTMAQIFLELAIREVGDAHML